MDQITYRDLQRRIKNQFPEGDNTVLALFEEGEFENALEVLDEVAQMRQEDADDAKRLAADIRSATKGS